MVMWEEFGDLFGQALVHSLRLSSELSHITKDEYKTM
jgi:hypothetical protein